MSVSREIPMGQAYLAPGLPSKQLITQLMSCSLTSLDLSAQMELEDKALLPILRHTPNLKTLILRSCLKIGDPTLQAAAKHCQRLQHINFNFCPITRSGLAVAMGQLSDLEVLKVASMNGLNDLHVFEMLAAAVDLAAQDRRLPLGKLRSLKLKGTSITEVGLAGFLSHCDQTLERLDISFTPIRTLDLVIVALFGQTTASAFKLKKLAMSGLSLKAGSLKKLFSAISNLPPQATLPLEKLKLGSMGAFLSTSAGNIDYLDSRLLPSLHKALLRCPNISSCSFAGNERLCNTSGFLGPLLSDLAPKLKFLDLSNTILSNSTTSRLKAADLHGLVENTDGTRHECAIEELRLDGTKVDDEAVGVLRHCKGLRSLHLANATITSEGLALIIANCPNLSILNLSGCRGIPVTMRRNAFQTIDNDMNRNADLQFDRPPSPPKRAKRKARQREYGFFQEYISAEDSDYDPQG